MNDIKLFENPEFGHVRIIGNDGYPWFVAKDVCDAIGLTNPSKAVKSLDNDERSNFELGRQGSVNIINESGLYSLIIRSNKPDAKKFRKWITSDVLPSIRKNGMYGTDDFVEQALADPDSMIKVLARIKEEKKQRLLAEQERDEAIRTKAHISDKKTATAMATASAKSRENKKLKDKLGEGENFRQVKAIPWLDLFFVMKKATYMAVGKHLTKKSFDMEYEIKKIPSPEFGHINAYHVDVIDYFGDDLEADENLLAKYRV